MKKTFWKLRNRNNYQNLIIKSGVIILGYITVLFVLRLPYINVIGSIFSYLQFLVAIFLIIILFNIRKDLYLITSLLLFLIGYFVYMSGNTESVETLGVISFFLIIVYLLLSIGELRK